MQSKSKTYGSGKKMYRYRYAAVSNLGCGVHSKPYIDLLACRRLVKKLKPTWPDIEVQRIRELLPNGPGSVWARQYEYFRNGKWVSERKVRETEWAND